MNEILRGKQEIREFLRVGKGRLEKILKEESPPIYKKDGIFKAVKSTLKNWYENNYMKE